MGMEDWRNKKEEDFNAEDWFWWNWDEDELNPIQTSLSFVFRDMRYRIWEFGYMTLYKITGEVVEELRYENYVDMLEDKRWENNTMSMSEMLRQLPANIWER